MKEILRTILEGMVDYPDQIKIEETRQSGNIVLFKIDANKSDIGKLIGKRGKNAEAIRTVCAAISYKEKIKILIEFPI